jgi:hypothetical protein
VRHCGIQVAHANGRAHCDTVARQDLSFDHARAVEFVLEVREMFATLPACPLGRHQRSQPVGVLSAHYDSSRHRLSSTWSE